MLCEVCNKNEATIHYKESICGTVKEYHLCKDCESILNLTNGFGKSLKGGLNTMFKFIDEKVDEEFYGKPKILKCPKCGRTLTEFEEGLFLGCESCYDTFNSAITGLSKNYHGATSHSGKKPQSFVFKKKSLQELEEELTVSIRREDFEKACVLRDEIAHLKEVEKHDN